eukprot:jgi/Ulvmu1/7859/UM004_0090.1
MANWADARILVTGSGSGIGKAATLRFLEQNARVTALDASGDGLKQLQKDAHQHQANLLTIRCDVSDDAAQEAAFRAHIAKWGRLDFALLNAGIGERGAIFASDDLAAWQPTLDIDLRAVLVGTQLAVRAMHARGTRGAIVSLASAAGVFNAGAEVAVYSAAKGGLVHFTRCSGKALARQGIHLATVCPQFVDTPLLDELPSNFRSTVAQRMGPLLSTDRVIDEIERIARDRSRAGAAVVLLQDGRVYDYNPVHQERRVRGARGAERAGAGVPVGPLPARYRAWQVRKLSREFLEAASLQSVAMPQELPRGCVLVKRLITGVNASDVNFTSGVYHGSVAAAQAQLPFVAGFESVGVIAKVGQDSELKVGQPVATLSYGGFSEYAVEKARVVVPVPQASAATVAFLTSGLTASVALDEARPQRGETALVTAAAGGTGLFAVQLLKQAGLHVIGTCGSESKAQLLRSLGADRVVNYKTENLKKVLQTEYSEGVHVVYEGVGGEMFKVAVGALAQRGRLLIIGMMSQYGKGWPLEDHPGLPEQLLKKSASLIGFFLPSHASKYKQHLDKLMTLHEQGKLQVFEDSQRFIGIESVPDAVQRLQSGDSLGKVVVYIDPAAVPTEQSRTSKL